MAVADGEEANIRYSEWLQCSQMIMVVFLGKLFDFLLLQNLLLLVTCVCVCVCLGLYSSTSWFLPAAQRL